MLRCACLVIVTMTVVVSPDMIRGRCPRTEDIHPCECHMLPKVSLIAIKERSRSHFTLALVSKFTKHLNVIS